MPHFFGHGPPAVRSPVHVLDLRGHQVGRIEIIQGRYADRDVLALVPVRLGDPDIGPHAAVTAEPATLGSKGGRWRHEFSLPRKGAKVLRRNAHTPLPTLPTARAIALAGYL